MVLLYVLHLFAKAFNLRLRTHHQVGKWRMLGFGSDCIDLPPHLLEQEIHLSPDRAFRSNQARKLVHVTAETNQLLGDVALVGEQGDFLL